MDFINNLEYFGRGNLLEEVEKKCLQRLIDIWLLIGTHSWVERMTIFGKFWNLWALLSLILISITCLLYLQLCAEHMNDDV